MKKGDTDQKLHGLANGKENSVEQPLEADEIILGLDGKRVEQSQAWQIALQKGSKGYVTGPDGAPIRRAKALRMAMDRDFEMLSRQLDAGVTENTRSYFEFAARMHRYSPGNIDLIFHQAPHARLVQGFTAWSRAGYKLKSREEGCQPIYVLQPRPYVKIKRIDEDGEEKEVQVISAHYRAVPVYDEGSIDESVKAVPEFFTPLQGNADMLTDRLTEVLAEDGIKVVYAYVDYQTEGGSAGGVIYLRPDLPSVNRFLILAHESLHEWLHKDEERRNLPRRIKECQAEVGAYLIASHFGIQSPISADYLRMYGVDKETLRSNMKITQDIVHKAIERMEEKYYLYAQFEYNPEADRSRRPYARKGKHKSRRKT